MFGAIIFYWIVGGIAMGAARRVVHDREGSGGGADDDSKENVPDQPARITRLGRFLGLVKIEMSA